MQSESTLDTIMHGKSCFNPFVLHVMWNTFWRKVKRAATGNVFLALFSLRREQSYSCGQYGPHLFVKHSTQGVQEIRAFLASIDLLGCVMLTILFCAALPCASSCSFFTCSWTDEICPLTP